LSFGFVFAWPDGFYTNSVAVQNRSPA
jgi:hypothetical protein